jgi:4-hydroxy-3-polyprenylbenzoate decarboxylase
MAVNWAIVNRCQPHRDMRIIHPRPVPHGPLRFVAKGYDSVDSALLIDATAKAPFPPISLPARPYMERALEIWKELGLGELNLRSPWFGYSLGQWSDESAAEAELAAQGKYFETGSKLQERRVAMPPGSQMAEVRKERRGKY